MGKKNREKWCKPRHKVLNALAIFLAGRIIRRKFHVKCVPFPDAKKRNYLILMNHQTTGDQFFCSFVFGKVVYYVATEDIFSNGLISKLLKWSIAPIPIDKTKVDISTVRNCLRVASEGGTIAIAPEGNRTYSGQTCQMKQSISKLVRAVKLPVAFLHIEGGYGVQPRWSNVIRKGKMKVFVSKVVEPEEYLQLTDEELFDLINKELYVNEAVADGVFRSKKSAEHLERAIYTCPNCGLSSWKSKGKLAHCESCGLTVKYNNDKRITSADGSFPFEFVADWMHYQRNLVNNLQVDKLQDKVLFTDYDINCKIVIPYHNKKRLYKSCSLKLCANKVTVCHGKRCDEWSFDDITGVAVMGRNKLNVNYNGTLYQFKGKRSFNALKYMNLWYRYQNFKEGITDGFIGI